MTPCLAYRTWFIIQMAPARIRTVSLWRIWNNIWIQEDASQMMLCGKERSSSFKFLAYHSLKIKNWQILLGYNVFVWDFWFAYSIQYSFGLITDQKRSSSKKNQLSIVPLSKSIRSTSRFRKLKSHILKTNSTIRTQKKATASNSKTKCFQKCKKS